MNTTRACILVVDDWIDMAESTAEILTLWGYDAIACDNGVAALVCAGFRCPDVVLLDLVMPRMNGFQFARTFRELPACGSVPLVAISGYSTPAYKARARQEGIGHYLLKPVRLDHLKTLLASLTELDRRHRPMRPTKSIPVGTLQLRRHPIPTRSVPASGKSTWQLKPKSLLADGFCDARLVMCLDVSAKGWKWPAGDCARVACSAWLP